MVNQSGSQYLLAKGSPELLFLVLQLILLPLFQIVDVILVNLDIIIKASNVSRFVKTIYKYDSRWKGQALRDVNKIAQAVGPMQLV